MVEEGLDFEKPLLELEKKIEELKSFASSESMDLSEEIKSEDKTTFERTMSNCSISCIGVVTDTKSFIIKGLQDREIIRTDVSDLERAWRGLND